MEAVRIGEHKLKLSLSVAEAEKYGISAGADCKDTAIVRRSVWQALDEAKAISGFDPSGDKLLIQFYKNPSGGCEIFVTKLGVLSEASARLVCASNRITIIEKRKTAYFLLEGIKNLPSSIKSAFLGENANNYLQIYDKTAGCDTQKEKSSNDNTAPSINLFRGNDGAEYLVCEELGRESPEAEHLSILEYATRLPDSAAKYIEEHFERIHIAKAILPN